jgi:hypothetical protein
MKPAGAMHRDEEPHVTRRVVPGEGRGRKSIIA